MKFLIDMRHDALNEIRNTKCKDGNTDLIKLVFLVIGQILGLELSNISLI